MLLLMLFLLIAGVRIAYALGISALFYLACFSDMSLLLLAQRISVGADSIVMLALPFFLLAGELMNAAGITERLVRFALSLIGSVRGGLSFVVVLTNMIMAAASGTAIASGAAVGSVMIPAMRKQGYPDGFSGAVNAVSATIGPVLPPSVGFIIFASVSNASVGKLFIAGILPGILLGIVLLVNCYIVSARNNYPKGNKLSFKEIKDSFIGAFWSLIMPVIIIGGIISGVVTATEAGVIAIVYGLIVGLFIHKTITVKDLLPILISSAKSTARIMIIISCAAAFGWIISRETDPQLILHLLSGITTDKYILLLILVAIFLIVGLVMEGGSLMIILTPLLLPVIHTMGIDVIHFGVVFQLSVMIGLVTPPVGILLFV
ncbi:MAG: TRAP transporter large permease, partial [Dysgonamonadaceae bacterium]|nr:TRAP transporter large permease [Dysgonamonadaceae bacterium]